MNTKRLSSESGQTLVLVVIGFLAFVAVLALVLDGGNAYAAKRQAQNAADAGALAGATYMCKHRDVDGGINTAEEYAVLNGAVDPPDVTASLDTASVVVTATVTKDTFFAGIIGFTEVSPRAVAEAACRPPGVGVLPIAWSCRENVVGEIKCTEDIGPCRTVDDPTGMNCTYILMDSVKVRQSGKPCEPDPENPDYCQNDIECSDQLGTPMSCYPDIDPNDPDDANKIDCDLDNDCIDELASGGSRSWLDLNGVPGGGANELKGWIMGEPIDPIDVHTWLPEESGVATSIFHTTADYMVGKNVILPVFNKLCDGLPTELDPETLDYCNAGSIDDDDLITNSTLNYHIISFSAFHVTCVQTSKNKSVAESGYYIHPSDKDCYGHARAVEVGSIDEKDKSIEGYFVRLNLGGFGGPGDWYDTGTFTVVLTR
ncbi:MAG: hypothetical protein A2030_08240 [Chloroflexi bacterium RBG_19FT_COMBO_50_10]|nr:MAG: hypothetical protein A2Y53_08840 [Chloroflexi bacterium RBG_16_47_49]OGO66306.1 MAG: hypothetical protein A2030_08240 [Chloroflexi bacterium RBG_19FT_COMBO_50_10]